MYKIKINKSNGQATIIKGGLHVEISEEIADNHTHLNLAKISSNKNEEIYSGLDVELEPLWKEVTKEDILIAEEKVNE